MRTAAEVAAGIFEAIMVKLFGFKCPRCGFRGDCDYWCIEEIKAASVAEVAEL